MRTLCVIAIAAMLVTMLSPAVMADGRNAGSVLVFPVHRSGQGFFTVICVTNTNLMPQTPNSFGGSTNVHYEYVNVIPGANPWSPAGCVIFDRVEFLTPADSLCVLTACHNAFAPGGQEGYVVVSAEDPALPPGNAWSHNYLIGSELVVSAGGVAYSVNAIPFSSPVAAGMATDLNGNTQLDFDGAEYEEIPDVLYIDSFIAVANSQLALINLTGGPLDINTIYISVWNDNEFALSATKSFNCWFDIPLHDVSPLFTQAFLASTINAPGELDLNCDGIGDVETGWASIDSINVANPGGASISNDGALLGSLTAGLVGPAAGGRLLWESTTTQANGSAFNP